MIDDLSDAQLAGVVEDLRASVRRLSLETKMFEGSESGILVLLVHLKKDKLRDKELK